MRRGQARHELALDNWARSPSANYTRPDLYALLAGSRASSAGHAYVVFWPPKGPVRCWCGSRDHVRCVLPAHKESDK